MNIQGSGGDRAHEATTVLVREAYRAAGDPTKYPEQLREGLRPWKPQQVVFRGRGGSAVDAVGGEVAPAPALRRRPRPHVDRIDTAAYDPLLGRTYAEIGADARSNHKCQGTGSVLAA